MSQILPLVQFFIQKGPHSRLAFLSRSTRYLYPHSTLRSLTAMTSSIEVKRAQVADQVKFDILTATQEAVCPDIYPQSFRNSYLISIP